MTVKKYMLSLAALMIAMTATVLTSCSKEDVNEIESSEVVTPGTHVEILTIAFPEQPQTRVAMDGDHNLTGWEEGDEVTLVRTHYEFIADESGPVGEIFNVEDTYTFTCTNAANGTFTGTMPDPWTVENCQLAFYNATGFDTDGTSFFYFSPKTRASQNMKDVVMLVAKNDGDGHFDMEIFGSILQVTNNTGADITASVKYSWFGSGRYYDCNEIVYNDPDFDGFGTNIGANVNHPIPLSKDAPTYVFIPVFDLIGGDEDFAVGLSAAGDAANECSIVPFKTNPGNAKLFKKTLGAPVATTGTAKRTGDIDVNWVQLWADGPKFAEYNVGASAPEEYGGYFAWGESSEKGDYSWGTYLWGTFNPSAAPKYGMNKYTAEADGGDGLNTLQAGDDPATTVWGDNWRTPTSAEVEGLFDPGKCEWTWDDVKKGYTITGLGTGNTIFLPAAGFCANTSTYRTASCGYYWTSSVNEEDLRYAHRFRFDTSRQEDIYALLTEFRFYGESVRAVLK